MATFKNTTLLNNQLVNLPAGTTAQRPSPVTGMMRYNTDTSIIEVYNGSHWQTMDKTVRANSIGGNSVYDRGNFRIHVFTGGGTFELIYPGLVEYLIVAGGGAGGRHHGGGGEQVAY